MPHFEMTTALDVETTRAITTQVLEERGFRMYWNNSWTGLGRRRFATVNLILFSPQAGLTVLRLQREGANWYLFLDVLGGMWVEGATNRLANALTDALTEREAELGIYGPY